MSINTHKNYDSKFKLKVALAAIKDNKSIEDLCKEFDIATSQIYAWKKQLEEHGDIIFTDKRKTENNDVASEKKLLATLEEVKAERDFLARVLSH